MRKAVLIGGLVTALAMTFFVLARRREPTLPGSRGLFDILPPIPGETRSVDEIKAATSAADPAIRREALRSLGRLEDHGKVPASDVLPFLLKGAADADGQARAVATAYLGQIRVEPALVVPRLAALLKDPEALVRMNAARGLQLRKTAAREALPALLEAWNDTDRDVRLNIAGALFWFPDAAYQLPEDWSRLSPEEATARARGMGLDTNAHSLQRAVRDNDVAAVFMLLRAGVPANSRSAEDKAGETPLFFASGFCRPEIVRFLLQAGADARLKDNFGRTAWDWTHDTRGPYGEENRRLLREAGGAP